MTKEMFANRKVYGGLLCYLSALMNFLVILMKN
jgi:hypothetical protein